MLEVKSRLTAIQVRNVKPQNKPYKLRDGHGMYLHVAKSGKKTWRYRFKIAGTESTFVIGGYPLLSLEQARAERIKVRELVKLGMNPAAARKEEKVIKQREAKRTIRKNTFEAIALEWVELQRERWSKPHADAVIATLKADAFPIIGDQPVDMITPPMILKVLRRIEKRGTLGIVHKVLQRMNATFRYAVHTGKATHNPAADMKEVLKTRKVKHMTALSQEDLPLFIKKLAGGDIHHFQAGPAVYDINRCKE